MPAALISQMTAPPGEDAAFDEWYRDEHIPARMEIPGFTGAIRAWAEPGSEPEHLAVYLADGLDVFGTDAYKALKSDPSDRTRHMLSSVAAFTRWIGEEISDTGESDPAPFLYLVTFAVPPEHQAAFDEWYEQEHVPMLMASEHWRRCRRYAVQSGEPADVTRLALHELQDPAALESPERAAARKTPWRARLAENEYFSSVRYAVYRRSADFTPARAG